ncbi:ABC transporter ATP-binding protein [Occultella kanbiaonis]|uniref:ABC transporter ATP-binding protein n=1 Tax=Occultella kanbiaonis TaxID=2675754 RepID=UPI0013D190E3|nr:ABC transporter ATP-binding protein [Occultella kanbiaonis]
MDSNIITIDGLRRRYRPSTPGAAAFEAVRGVDLRVRRGELFALLGTNGAGKTSLMEVVEGIAPATDGQVRVLGHDPYAARAKVRPHIGIMLQEAGFPSDLRVLEMARTWAATLPAPMPPEDVLAAVGLAHRAGVAVKSLSGGERRRLDLALAIMGRPQVLFLDEPTTGLDPESRRDAWDLVRSMLADGVTVVLTTHYLEEAEDLADRIAIMHEGVVVAEGTPAEIGADAPATISFTLATGQPLPPLHGRDSADASARGVRHLIRTQHLQADLRILLDWSQAQDVALDGLDARAASLEQAFLTIAAGGRPTHDLSEVPA